MTDKEVLELIRSKAWNVISGRADRVDWDRVSTYRNLPEDFCRIFKYYVNWENVVRYSQLSEPFIEECINEKYITWWDVSQYQELSEQFMDKHIDELDMWTIEDSHTFSPNFIRTHMDRVSIINQVRRGEMDRDTLEEFKDYVIQHADKEDWKYISQMTEAPIYYFDIFKDHILWDITSRTNYDFTGEFLQKYGTYINWDIALKYKYFKMKFIKKYWKKYNWSWKTLCHHQHLSEDFIRKYEKFINWEELTNYCILSERLIEDMTDHFNKKCWTHISAKQRLTRDFVFRHLEDINLIGLQNNYHIRWNKKNAIYALELIQRKREDL